MRDIVERYRDLVLPKKQPTTQRSEGDLLRGLLARDFVELSLADIGPETFSTFRDQRLEATKPATVSRELGLLQHAFEIARREGGRPADHKPADSGAKAVREERTRATYQAG